jgi:hypothetical protein
MSDPSRSNDPKPIGDAGSLFDTDELRPLRVKPSSETARPPSNEGYDLEGGPIADDEELPQPVPIPIPSKPVERPKPIERPKAKPKLEIEQAEPSGSSEFEDEEAEVEEVWSRWAEWGPDLIRIGAVGLGTLFLAWLFSGSLPNAFFALVLGGAAMVLLSYPILITLERPVRITPEHAVSDFFDAASHHFPHYRRMWLLLSDKGRESGRFTSFEPFRDYWKGRIEGWKQSKGANKFVPLKFEVENFRVDKSTGKETSKASYSVVIYLRDREAEGPIETFRVSHGLVKGADRMWYMNQGVLDNRSK